MTAAILSAIGIWLLVAGVLVIIIELVLMAVWGLAMGRRMQALSRQLSSERAELQADVERLKRAMEETKALWRPYMRILRWLRHPLVLALLGSYRRRMVQ
ncbi:MAG: hypothetical protein E6I23_07990 [Chloroflexi bacterium]|nr:MAG: hypothetical protein AUH32_00325 [Actinobacteria bacterium 13_1_40CM_66_12]TMF44208.1 MAG: hypothetical protein E6I23_07990 [Chloroflexota bacterium]